VPEEQFAERLRIALDMQREQLGIGEIRKAARRRIVLLDGAA
jgi:hypothetical protein